MMLSNSVNREQVLDFIKMERKSKTGWIYKKSCFYNPNEECDLNTTKLTGISPSERLSSMYETGLYSDCVFVAEDSQIRAHRIVLAFASPKFEQILMKGDFDPNEPIEMPYSLRVLQLVLKHCYLQDLDIENIDEAQDVIEAANELEMKDLVDLCCTSIEPASLDDLFPALNLACRFNSRTLKETCLTMSADNSDNILEHPGLLSLTPEAFSTLINREVVQINSEKDIIQAAIIWAQNRLEIDPDSNLRTELNQCNILKVLRILALPEDEFILFVTGIGQEILNEDELVEIEKSYYGETTTGCISSVRTERNLEERIAISGFDYISANSEQDFIETQIKVNEHSSGTRPIIKMLVVPSQMNPANILYDNVSHKTHYDECILVEITVKDKVVARGSFYGRVKYSEDIPISINTFNYTPIYAETKSEMDERNDYYIAKIKIIFRTFGYYPLAIETKNDKQSTIELLTPCRYINEFVITTPKIQ